MPLLKNVSPNWVSPIAVPGHGVYYPSMGLQDIPEEAIVWLESIGYVVDVTPPVIEETLKEEINPKKKRSVKTEVDTTSSED